MDIQNTKDTQLFGLYQKLERLMRVRRRTKH